MELVKADNISVRNQKPGLSINKKGMFAFNKSATTDLNLLDSKIDLFYDKKERENWYLRVHKEGDITIRKNSGDNACFNSSSLAEQIKDSTKNSVDQTLTVGIGKSIEHDDMTIYPLMIKVGNVRNY